LLKNLKIFARAYIFFFFFKKKIFFFISWEGAKSLTFPGEFADFLKNSAFGAEFFSPFFRICRLFSKKNGKMQIRKNGEKNSLFCTSIFQKSAKLLQTF
jgi:hypothetical protein